MASSGQRAAHPGLVSSPGIDSLIAQCAGIPTDETQRRTLRGNTEARAARVASGTWASAICRRRTKRIQRLPVLCRTPRQRGRPTGSRPRSFAGDVSAVRRLGSTGQRWCRRPVAGLTHQTQRSWFRQERAQESGRNIQSLATDDLAAGSTRPALLPAVPVAEAFDVPVDDYGRSTRELERVRHTRIDTPRARYQQTSTVDTGRAANDRAAVSRLRSDPIGFAANRNRFRQFISTLPSLIL